MPVVPNSTRVLRGKGVFILIPVRYAEMPDENTRNRTPSDPVAKKSSLARAKLVKNEKQREARTSFLMKSFHSVESSRGRPLSTRTFIQALQTLLQNHLVTGFAGIL